MIKDVLPTAKITPSHMHKILLECIKKSGQTTPALSEALWNIKEKKLYKLQGLKSWRSYIAQPDITMSYGRACRLAALYDFYVSERGYDTDLLGTHDTTKLYLVRKCVELDGAEWIDKCLVLSYSDLADEVRERLGHPPKEIVRAYNQETLQKTICTHLENYFPDLPKDRLKLVAARVAEDMQ